MQTLIGRQALAERWDFDNPNSLIKYESEGIITRNPNFKAPKYYIEEILKIESLGDVNPLSPLERRRLEKENQDLRKELEHYKNIVNEIKIRVS